METWRAIMTRGPYSADASSSLAASKAARYGVLDDDADKLVQPLISRRDSADAGYNYAPYDYDSDHVREYDDLEDHDALLRKAPPPSARGYDEISLKPSPVALLRSLVQNVLWPMTAVGAQTAKVFQPRRTVGAGASTAAAMPTVAYDVDDRAALRSVTTLRALTKPRARRAETLDDVHERALVRIALATVVFSAWLIITVYRHAD